MNFTTDFMDIWENDIYKVDILWAMKGLTGV